MNRNILGKLVSYAMKTGRKIDYLEALQYPICPVPLSLNHVNGTKRSCVKSDLRKIIIPNQSDTPLHPPAENTIFIYELMPAI